MQGTGKGLARAGIVTVALAGAFATGVVGTAAAADAQAQAGKSPAADPYAPAGTSAAAAPQAQAAATSLSVKRGPAVNVPAAIDAASVYDVGDDAEVGCGSGKTALVAGWSGAQAIVDRVLPDSDASGFTVELRRPMTKGKLTPLAVCLSGAPKATVETSSSGSVSCGSKLAIGVPATSTWPYNERAVSAGPQGTHGWKTTATNSTGAAICVAPSALGSVATTTKTARFALGRDSASVAATCRGAARPIGWGYDAPLMEGNGWSSADTDSRLLVPFISAAQPQGSGGWRLTFRTPDGRGAKSAAPVAIRLTCGVPKAGASLSVGEPRASGAALAEVSLPRTRATAIVLNSSFAGLRIGQSVAAARRAWGEAGCTDDGLGGLICVYELRNSSINYNTGNVAYTATDGKVTGFRIRAPWNSVGGQQVYETATRALLRYETDRGIGLNATIAQLRAAYPKVRLSLRQAGTSVFTLAGSGRHRSTFSFSPTPSGRPRLAALTTE